MTCMTPEFCRGFGKSGRAEAISSPGFRKLIVRYQNYDASHDSRQ
jgi:hypothetical protein